MTWSHNLRCFLAQMLLVLPPSRVVFFSSTCVSRANNSTRKGNSRSKQKRARALNPRSLLLLEKKIRKNKKKKKGTRVVDHRGILLHPRPLAKVLFCARARALFFGELFFFVFWKKNEAFFGKKTRRFFCISEPYSCIGRKKKKKRVLLARFELAISRLLSGRLNHLATKARLIILD